VIEVKNVPLKGESLREHINQVVTYGLAYRAKRVVIVHPRASAVQMSGLKLLGEIDHVTVYQYTFDLGADELDVEDEHFGAVSTSLLAA